MSMEIIECSDLLLEKILLNLPPKSIYRFMSVSQRWNNIMKDPYFLHIYSIARKTKTGLSSKRLLALIDIKSQSQSPMSILTAYQTNDFKFEEKVSKKLGDFISCSEGLILCGRKPDRYYIYSPIRRTFFILPPPLGQHLEFNPSMGLVCEENTNQFVPNFRVVCADIVKAFVNTLSIQTYSSKSKTNEWTSSTLLATGNFKLADFRRPVVCDGIFHWFTRHTTLVVYDSNECDDNNRMQLIVLPCDKPEISQSSVTRSSSDDILWFVVNKKGSKCFEFWMLPKDGCGYKRSTTIQKTEWILMHRIKHDSMRQKLEDECDDHIKLEWLIPGNPLVALLRIGRRICVYSLETDSMELVQFYSDRCASNLYPYMEPISLSSYAQL